MMNYEDFLRDEDAYTIYGGFRDRVQTAATLSERGHVILNLSDALVNHYKLAKKPKAANLKLIAKKNALVVQLVPKKTPASMTIRTNYVNEITGKPSMVIHISPKQ